ncbi:MAG: hypothetical protein LBB38_04280 [Puniceicoccales bacterium]|nr:hypothetical protein [Puniceicoccales bacterium]
MVLCENEIAFCGNFLIILNKMCLADEKSEIGLIPALSVWIVVLPFAGATALLIAKACKTEEAKPYGLDAISGGLSKAEIFAFVVLTIVSAGIFYLALLFYVLVKKGDQRSAIGVLWSALARLKNGARSAKGPQPAHPSDSQVPSGPAKPPPAPQIPEERPCEDVAAMEKRGAKICENYGRLNRALEGCLNFDGRAAGCFIVKFFEAMTDEQRKAFKHIFSRGDYAVRALWNKIFHGAVKKCLHIAAAEISDGKIPAIAFEKIPNSHMTSRAEDEIAAIFDRGLCGFTSVHWFEYADREHYLFQQFEWIIDIGNTCAAEVFNEIKSGAIKCKCDETDMTFAEAVKKAMDAQCGRR